MRARLQGIARHLIGLPGLDQDNDPLGAGSATSNGSKGHSIGNVGGSEQESHWRPKACLRSLLNHLATSHGELYSEVHSRLAKASLTWINSHFPSRMIVTISSAQLRTHKWKKSA
jgi:hypothetical protein